MADSADDPGEDQNPDGDTTGGFVDRVFGSRQFFRMWIAMVASSTGDWLGLIAIATLAGRIGAATSSESAAVGGLAISVVLAARLVPGFFLAPVAGVLVDYWDRRSVMIVCDIGRAMVMVSLPFVDTVPGLVFASFVLELLTMLWTPAKEASIPHLVPRSHLASVNSLSLAAAYGTFPVASALFAGLATVAAWFGTQGWTSALHLNQEGLAFYFDAVTFLATAAIVSTLTIPPPERSAERLEGGFALGQTYRDLREGWRMSFSDPTVRAVNVGLATALIGGAMIIPLGPGFAHDGLGAVTDAAYGWLMFALGSGVAAGIIVIGIVQRSLPKALVFAGSILVAGMALIFAAASSSLFLATGFVLVLGFSAGTTYVLAMTILHERVDDELRGRVFATFFTLVRTCVLLAMVAGPLVGGLLGQLLPDMISFLGATVELTDERLALLTGGVIVLLGGLIAALSLRAGQRARSEAEGAGL